MRNDIYDLQTIETHIDFVVQLEEENGLNMQA